MDSPALFAPRDGALPPHHPLDLVCPPESDARDEPGPAPAGAALRAASTRPELATPPNPASIPVDPPKGSPPPPIGDLLPDVEMAEHGDSPHPHASNGMDVDVPAYANGHANGSSGHAHVAIAGSNTLKSPRPRDDDDGDEHIHPAAKRARTFSDADQTSAGHVTTPMPPDTGGSSVYTNGANGVSDHATPVPDTPMGGSSNDGLVTMEVSTMGGMPFSTAFAPNVWRYATSVIKRLKTTKELGPFLHPVDPVLLNIPHYPTIIKNPMDLSTIERKLQSSNPNKPDPNQVNPRYFSWDEFIADIRLIVSNCLTFNGPEHAISKLAQKLEEILDKAVRNMPAPQFPKVSAVKKASPTPPPPKKVVPARRASTSVPTIRRNEAEAAGRPKREIHPPPPKDLPYAEAARTKRRVRTMKKNNPNSEQLKFCGKILVELHKKQYWSAANPFYDPVDWQKLNIPAYPKLIKKPMDLSTMRKKLEAYEYHEAEAFRRDFALMINNCFTFNPPGTPVNQAGVELDRIFHDKWKSLPPLQTPQSEEEDEEESEDEAAQKIAEMENQIAQMNQNLADLKNQKHKRPKEKKEKKEKKERPPPPPVASTSKPSGKKSSGKKKSKKPITDDDVLSFDQKKELSETIQVLDGAKLEKVITIIHEGVPEIRDSTEEIELDIDSLPASVLMKLYNFVLRPLKKEQHHSSKRSRPGPGTGGLKRKSMDESAEAEKIRALEDRLRMFDPNAVPATSAGSVNRRPNGVTEQSSDSSSDSDSSGSDSE